MVACVIFGRFIQKNVNDFLIEFTNGIGQRCRRGKFIPFHQKMNYLCFFMFLPSCFSDVKKRFVIS